MWKDEGGRMNGKAKGERKDEDKWGREIHRRDAERAELNLPRFGNSGNI